MAERAMGNVISPGIKVMVLAVIIGIDDTIEGRDSFLGKTAPTRDSSAWARGLWATTKARRALGRPISIAVGRSEKELSGGPLGTEVACCALNGRSALGHREPDR